jgi:hypothetical protein
MVNTFWLIIDINKRLSEAGWAAAWAKAVAVTR